MIDLHSHTFLSDGCLVPSELARRALVNGVKAFAITDHVDSSNVEFVVTALVKAANEINKYWDIYVMPGVEITHAPLESFKDIVKKARSCGAKMVLIHGESPVEPVIKGTNRAAISAGIDVLAHPGYITLEDAILAKEKEVYLEISMRKGHCNGNSHVLKTALKAGAKMVLNSDSHAPENLMTQEKVASFLKELTNSEELRNKILGYSEELVKKVKSR